MDKTTSSKAPFYVEPKNLNQINKAKERVIKGNKDRVFLVDGREGAGKSTLAMQLAYLFDNTFGIDDIVFNAEDFAKRIREVPKFKAIVFDEAFNGLSNRTSLSKANRDLVRLLMECRQRNLFIFIVLPSMFLLEKYVALFRSHALFHVYTSIKNPERSYYKIYNYQAKKLLYIFGKQTMSYKKPLLYKSAAFYSKLPPTVKLEDYLAKKHSAFQDNEKKKAPEDNKDLENSEFFLAMLKILLEKSNRSLAVLTETAPKPFNRTKINQIWHKWGDVAQKALAK